MVAETSNQILLSWGAIASIIASIFAAAIILYSVYRYIHCARFLVTIVPIILRNGEMEKHIKQSGLDELRIIKNQSLAEIKTKKDVTGNSLNHKIRTIISINGYCEVPFLMQNVGNKGSGNLKLSVRFDTSSVQITEIHFETFKIEHFYNSRPNEITTEELRSINMDEKVLKYYTHIGITRAYLSMESTFSGGAFELVVIGLSVPIETKSFVCVLSIECPNVLHKRQVLAQRFNVEHI